MLFKIICELITYIGLAVLGASTATWVLHHIFEVYYYG
jgi:hypothetical protein